MQNICISAGKSVLETFSDVSPFTYREGSQEDKENEKSRSCSRAQLFTSGCGPNLQRKDMARHFLVDRHARIVDRIRRNTRLDLSFNVRLHCVFLRRRTSLP